VGGIQGIFARATARIDDIIAFGDQETLLKKGFLDLPKTFDYCPGARRFQAEIVLVQDDFGSIFRKSFYKKTILVYN
jgi:hypothetical protein